MHKIWIPKIDKEKEFAEYIDELNTEQYVYYCKLICDFMKGVYSFFEIKILLVYKLLDMEVSDLKNEAENIEKGASIYKLTEAVESFFDIEKKGKKLIVHPAIGFVKNMLPVININNQKYYGPDDLFINVTFKEHMQAAYCYNCYVQTKNEAHLDKLLSIFYRPSKPKTQHNINSAYDGDRRLPYYPAKSEETTEVFKSLDFHLKFAIYLWFQSVQDFICTATEIPVLGTLCNFSILFQESKSNLKGIGMPGVLFDLVKTGVIGNKTETENEMYLNILLSLYKQHLDAENLKQSNVKN